MISLKHEKHGFHNVFTEADALACESNGWVRCDLEKEIQAAISAKNLTHEGSIELQVVHKKRKYTKKVKTDDFTEIS